MEQAELVHQEVAKYVDVVPSECFPSIFFGLFLLWFEGCRLLVLGTVADGMETETMQEFSQFNWGHDIVQRTVELAREVSPGFELPEGFFKGNPCLPRRVEANGNGQAH